MSNMYINKHRHSTTQKTLLKFKVRSNWFKVLSNLATESEKMTVKARKILRL